MTRMRTTLTLLALVAVSQSAPLQAGDPGDEAQPVAAKPATGPKQESTAESSTESSVAPEQVAPPAQAAAAKDASSEATDEAEQPERFIPTQKTTADNSATFPVDI